MKKVCMTAVSATAFVLAGAAASLAVPQAIPTYTFCEEEGNDLCVDAQEIDASIAVAMTGNVEEVRDCFYITGKLQEDCVWDRQPKCIMKAFDKPQPARNSSGQIVNGQFCEPLKATSVNGRILNLAPNSDGTIRLGVGAFIDGFDGTFNGLGQNEPHGETGEVTVKVFCEGDDDGPARGGGSDDPDFEYVFRFVNGADALRVAFECESGVSSVDIHCCDDTGQVPICYDVDFYNVSNLIPGRAYCVTVVGGQSQEFDARIDPVVDLLIRLGILPPHVELPSILVDKIKTDTKLGWFDKNCNLIGGEDGKNDDGGNPSPYSNLCVFADGDGNLRFGVSGGAGRFAILIMFLSGWITDGPDSIDLSILGDCNFNGLTDLIEEFYFFYHVLASILADFDAEYTPGASLKDESADLVIRYPRHIWEDEDRLICNLLGLGDVEECPPIPLPAGFPPEFFFQHGVCGGYCIKVQLAEHVDPGERPDFPPASNQSMSSRSDMTGDGIVNASDLAVLLSHWGVITQ